MWEPQANHIASQLLTPAAFRAEREPHVSRSPGPRCGRARWTRRPKNRLERKELLLKAALPVADPLSDRLKLQTDLTVEFLGDGEAGFTEQAKCPRLREGPDGFENA